MSDPNPSRLLLIHGAGGYAEDRLIADGLGAILGVEVQLPRLPETDMSFEAWAAPVRAAVTDLGPTDLLVGHSFGASILLRVLAEQLSGIPAHATLLAMPEWGPDGWDYEDYAFTPPEPQVSLTLHHCRDDAVVPFEHLALNSALLPSAQVREHAAGGHQFDGLLEALAAEIADRGLPL